MVNFRTWLLIFLCLFLSTTSYGSRSEKIFDLEDKVENPSFVVENIDDKRVRLWLIPDLYRNEISLIVSDLEDGLIRILFFQDRKGENLLLSDEPSQSQLIGEALSIEATICFEDSVCVFERDLDQLRNEALEVGVFINVLLLEEMDIQVVQLGKKTKAGVSGSLEVKGTLFGVDVETKSVNVNMFGDNIHNHYHCPQTQKCAEAMRKNREFQQIINQQGQIISQQGQGLSQKDQIISQQNKANQNLQDQLTQSNHRNEKNMETVNILAKEVQARGDRINKLEKENREYKERERKEREKKKKQEKRGGGDLFLGGDEPSLQDLIDNSQPSIQDFLNDPGVRGLIDYGRVAPRGTVTIRDIGTGGPTNPLGVNRRQHLQ